MKTPFRLFAAALALAIVLPTTALGQYPLRATILPTPISPQAGAEHGKSVAADETYLVVGAQKTDVGVSDAGAAVVYSATTGARLLTLLNPSPGNSDYFGYTVAVSGTIVVVGAYQDSGSGSAYVYDLASATPTMPVWTLNNPSPAGGDAFGCSVSVSGNRVVVGAFDDDTVGTNAGSAYVYDLTSATPTVPVRILNNPAPATGDNFGTSVAISGNRVVVGAELDDAGATNAGSAYVYDLGSATPTVPVATLNNPSPGADDFFGFSVAVSGSRVVVGAYGDDPGGPAHQGTAYVYDVSSGTPTVPVAILSNPAPATSDLFGVSVSVSGTRVVVGAGSDDAGFTDSGSVYVYDFGSATPTVPIATFNNPNSSSSDFFGDAVAVSGNRVLVGAYGDDAGGGEAGAAYLYDLATPTPTTPVATLQNPEAGDHDNFGTAVALSGNLLVVGAPGDPSTAVYDLGSETPAMPVANLSRPAGSSGFGNAVAVSGNRVAVGAHLGGVSSSGSAYVYDVGSPFPTVPTAILDNPSPAASDQFGIAVAVSGNLVVAGAPNDDIGASNAGSAYVYDLSSATPTVPVWVLNNPSPATDDWFGITLAISGNILVVGATGEGGNGIGAAYVYDLGSATPTVPVAILNHPNPGNFERFGRSVAVAGNRVVVGAFRYSVGGGTYVFDLSSATPTVPVVTLNNPNQAASDQFGGSVSVSGNLVVVGDSRKDVGVSDVGVAYVFDMASATPTVPAATFANPTPATFDYFGIAVAVSGNRLAVGAFQDDTASVDEGAVYVYGDPVGTPLPGPEIRIDQPSGTSLTDGASSVDFGPVATGGTSARTFTIKNLGTLDLTGLGITIDGPDASAFAVTAAPSAPVVAGGSTTFTVTFTHTDAGPRTAALHVASNDANENPFDLTLTGRDHSANADLTNLVISPGTLTPAFATATTSYTVSVPYSTGSLTVTPTVAEANVTVKVNGVARLSGTAGNAIVLGVGSNLITVAVTAEDGVTMKTYTIDVTRAAGAVGEFDPAFNPIVNGTISATAVQPDGKTVIAGAFTTVGGQTRNGIARLNANGTVEITATFNAGTGANSSFVYCAAVQADGKILLGGFFTSVNGQTRNRIARLNANGTVESTATFNPGTGADSSVLAMAVQTNGKILLVGSFTSVNGQARNRIARLNADGTVESTTTFNPGTGADLTVRSVVVQADGKILLGGDFTAVNGQPRTGIARLNADGTLESTATFNAGVSGGSGSVFGVAVQPDGKILLGGFFTSVNGQPRNRIARIHANGTVESTTTFNAGAGANDLVYSIAAQADGKILLGGAFLSVDGQPRSRIARLLADGSVESTATFNPGTGPNNSVESVAVAADGKIILGGAFTSVNGMARNNIAWLNNAAATQSLSSPNGAQVQWMRGGAAPEVEQVTFELSTNGGASWSALGDGTRIPGGWDRNGLALPASGSIRGRGRTTAGSGSFGLVEQVLAFTVTHAPEIVVEQPAGAGLVDGGTVSFLAPLGGSASRTFTIRNRGDVNLTGLGLTIDGPDAARFTVTASPTAPVAGPNGSTTFTVQFTQPTAGSRTATLHIASNDADENPFDLTLNGREFTTNANLGNLVLSAGTLTPAFAAATTSYTATVPYTTTSLTVTPTAADANATVKVNGATVLSGEASNSIALNVGSNPLTVAVTAEDGVTVKTYTVNVTRAAPGPGNLDLDFNLNVVGIRIRATAVQPDGKTLVVGSFSSLGGQVRNYIARLNADATVESTATFNVGTGANNDVTSVALQADGKILVGGYFTTVNGQARTRIVRLLANGNVESTATFNAGTGANNGVESIAVQPDGKIVLGGFFTSVNGQVRNSIARLNADGTLESTATFNPGTGANGAVRSVVVQPDGKILLGGFFTSVNGQTRNYLARLNADGTLESTATFNPGTGANAAVNCVAVQADGKIVVGGQFATFNGQPRSRIARLHADGSVESTATFNIGTGAENGFFGVQSLAVQANGKILLGGDFNGVNSQPRNGIARLHPDGSVEETATFDLGSGVGVGGIVYSVALQADGKIVLGGEFTAVNGQPRNKIARLANDTATQTLTVPNSTRVEWLRGGAAPEVGPVTFELSTNGGASWSALGAGMRIAGGWERTGLSLPASGSIRARGRAAAGSWNGSSGLVQQIAAFTIPDADSDGLLDTWEIAHFGSTAIVSALDDFDADGRVELLELAFGGNPQAPDAAATPAAIEEGGFLTITLTKRAGVTLAVQTASGPEGALFSTATTTTLLDNATTLKVRDNFPIATTPQRFLRVRVTAAP